MVGILEVSLVHGLIKAHQHTVACGVERKEAAVVCVLHGTAVLVRLRVGVALVEGLAQILYTQVLCDRVRAAPAAGVSVADGKRCFVNEAGLVPLLDSLSVLGRAKVVDGC